MILHLFQKNANKNTKYSRIGVERMINSVIGLVISFEEFEFIKINIDNKHIFSST